MTGAELTALVKKHKWTSGAVVLIIGFGLMVYFRGGAIAEKTEASTAKADEAAKIQSNITSATGLADQTQVIQAAVKDIDTRLVRASQLATNLQYFYRMEADTGVKILDARQGSLPALRAGAAKPTYVGVPYSVSVQGSYAQTLAFLRRLETGRHFVRLVSVTYSKAGSSDMAGPAEVMTLALSIELLGQP